MSGKDRFTYQFGSFRLDPVERELRFDGAEIRLPDKVFETLLFLVENNGRLLTKEEMMDSIWKESFVEESNLAKNISRLRKVLDADGSSHIETLPKRGYRFRSAVSRFNGHEGGVASDPETSVVMAAAPDGVKQSGSRPTISVAKMVVFAILVAAITAIPIVYFLTRERPRAAYDNGAIRLTNDDADEGAPHWVGNDQIRYLRRKKGEPTESMIMSADGSSQSSVGVRDDLVFCLWSPDGARLLFVREGEKDALYLANSDGSGEVKLPFAPGNLDWSPDSQSIVYQSKVTTDDSDIFLYSLETGANVNLTQHLAFDADPSFSPDGSRIAFASLRDGNAEIYVMDSSGDNVRRLTDHPSWDSHPVFSPDGTTIAFPSDRESEDSDVYLMSADGVGPVQRLTNWKTDEFVGPGAWSPDGTKIAFVSDREGTQDIFVINAEIYRITPVIADHNSDLKTPSYSANGDQILYEAGSSDTGEIRVLNIEFNQSRTLFKTALLGSVPKWSPGGDWIAFQDRVNGNTEICLIAPDGSGLRNLTHNTARDGAPSFSPNGREIVFSSNRDGNSGLFQLYVMNADGGNVRQVYRSEGTSVSPVWLPDGETIVFANDKEGGRRGNFEIFTVNAGGGKVERRLTSRNNYDSEPAISPDGKHIAFTSRGDGNSEIYVMNADGTNLSRLTRNLADDVSPRFSPDGNRIIFSSNREGKYSIYELVVRN
jgi:Tol biopolymer transport system component/DNA-binding winged helix-turn-helix (wHTH) protein